jgi:membrane-bound lytic murein transglycosylase D
MLRQKIYSAVLLIFCSVVITGKIKETPGPYPKQIITTPATILQKPVFTPSRFDLNPAALQFATVYLKENNWGLERLKKRSRSSFRIINSVFSKHAIPAELKYMAVIESNLISDTVCNSSGATGIWQLMPATADELGLKISDENDERLHIYKSSVAVAKYLKQLYAEFGDWLLVIAAYNSGPAKVIRAVQTSGTNDFWKLQNLLPAESRNHVKRFLSVLHFFESQET